MLVLEAKSSTCSTIKKSSFMLILYLYLLLYFYIFTIYFHVIILSAFVVVAVIYHIFITRSVSQKTLLVIETINFTIESLAFKSMSAHYISDIKHPCAKS